MPSVYLCSPTNSQMFTTCCQTAICDNEQKCPECKKYVYPFDEFMTDKEREEVVNVSRWRWNKAYKK